MSDDTQSPVGGQDAFPLAEIRPARVDWRQTLAKSKLWWLTAACLVVAVVLTFASLRRSGTRIAIRFAEGHGIKPGDRLRYRGIDVGEVRAVEVDEALEGVLMQVELGRQAERLARAGSRFWIERPQVGLSRISGLETVVGAKHLGVLPGPADAPPAFDFEGVETPPVLRSAAASEIVIRFREGNGLAVGDFVKFRGIVVGEVTQVTLKEDLSGIEVRVRLAEGAGSLARTGSQFWVERPQFTAAEIRGLDTLVGGRYLDVLPGPAEAAAQVVFEGLDQPPAGLRSEGGLEVVLEGASRHGLQRGAPVQYRGLRIGHVISVSLAPEATGVEARVYIEPQYKPLVRENSVFWRASGIDVSIGLSGVQLSADTLASIAVGGVSLATPDPPGKIASTGQRFVFYDEKRKEWLEWRPAIALSGATLPEGLSLPRPQRAVLMWTERLLGMPRRRERAAWVLPLEDGRLLGPADLLAPEAASIGEAAVLETMGQSLPFAAAETPAGPIAVYALPDSTVRGAVPGCALDRFRLAVEPEDCVLLADPAAEPLPLPASRLQAAEGFWSVDPALPLGETWHGAAAIAESDGKIVGLLLVNGGARIFPIPPLR